MKGKTLLPLTVLIAGGLMLTACGKHENPLLTQPKVKVVAFLRAADASANKQTKMGADLPGYTVCLSNPSHFDTLDGAGSGIKQCKAFFSAMVDYAKTTKKFSALTLADLNDKAVMTRFGGNSNLDAKLGF